MRPHERVAAQASAASPATVAASPRRRRLRNRRRLAPPRRQQPRGRRSAPLPCRGFGGGGRPRHTMPTPDDAACVSSRKRNCSCPGPATRGAFPDALADRLQRSVNALAAARRERNGEMSSGRVCAATHPDAGFSAMRGRHARFPNPTPRGCGFVQSERRPNAPPRLEQVSSPRRRDFGPLLGAPPVELQ